MMTLDDVRAEGYELDDENIVVSPGKFESEHAIVVALWSLVLDGGADETIYRDERPIDVFRIDDEIRTNYPDVLNGSTVAIAIWESEQGFVNSEELTQAELDELLNAPPTEPDEDDITTHDHERFYQSGRLVLEREHKRTEPDPSDRWFVHERGTVAHLGNFGRCEDAIRAYMDRSQYFPNVWFISDHGNAHLMKLEDAK